MNEPIDEQEVTRLLRDARVSSPMPDLVAARLDDVLAGLADSPAPEVATVLPLRRRLAPKLLAAAAAVVLVGGVGVGIAQVQQGAGGGDEASAGSALQEDADGGGRESAPVPQAPATPGKSLDRTIDELDARLLQSARPVELREAARALVEGTTPRGAATSAPDEADDRAAPGFSSKQEADCPTPSLAEEDGALSEVVLLDAVPALLVVGPAEDGARPVELWSCGSDLRIAADELPVDAAE